jgi:hypothetical protein
MLLLNLLNLAAQHRNIRTEQKVLSLKNSEGGYHEIYFFIYRKVQKKEG